MKTQTETQFEQATKVCRDVFEKKMMDYGTAWRIMRPTSMTDQLLIKARRIRSIEEKGESRIAEGIRSEFIGIVNYAAMALIQVEQGPAQSPDENHEATLALYSGKINAAWQLMNNKNHDYDEAWRDMRVSSYTDLILMKIHRTKEIENHHGETIASEGVEANYMDMINYALFAIIQLDDPMSNFNK